ncbi:single-stranded-DNA-specific exonuclease RecJ [Chondrocystis sp. NIES-4102]|nr:single-stranded-DNA-specific exonuclease RecJ [Chondrocystis sp. NIES-4102]
MLNPKWQLLSSVKAPPEFVTGVQAITGKSKYCAQLLWQRGIQNLESLPGFLNPDLYQPASPFAFGEEMIWAIERLIQARDRSEKVTIWGDFDADGITSTSVLWEGLGQFFPQYLQLDYYIPNRLTESHGLNNSGIAKLAENGTKLLVTCDTGSTNLEEIKYAQELGIDIIVTDHHTLPESRPDVVAIINPRYLATDHPLFSLSGVAVAYKLVEALYTKLPTVPQQPLENLLDLVAIGLIADLVELKADCRYLAQIGIKQLQKQVEPTTTTRPGVAKLLNLCRRNGDRPTDISYGLGPRINAVSRIYGDASFCVELLTSRDQQRCQQLAEEAELANTRRKSLQKETIKQIERKVQQIDLSTTAVIVIEDPQWQGGVLGLAAGQIAQEYGRPTILLSSGDHQNSQEVMARGSARSVNGIDLYQLVKSQANLLHRFGGHPFAAGLSLPLANLELFKESINQQLRQSGSDKTNLTLDVDLEVTVADLGKELFEELRLLEPYGMGNPIPRLLIKNCWFKNVHNKNIEDKRGNKLQYIKTSFTIWDETTNQGFPGLWWEHYQDEIPLEGKCEAIAELDFNTFSKKYEIRLVALRLMSDSNCVRDSLNLTPVIIDRRNDPGELEDLEIPRSQASILQDCPITWDEIEQQYYLAKKSDRTLVLAYNPKESEDPRLVWQQLVGITKYLIRSQKPISKAEIMAKLSLSEATFDLGLQALKAVGFEYKLQDNYYQVAYKDNYLNYDSQNYIDTFILALGEEKFQQQYFYQVPLATIKKQLLINN